MTDQQLTSNDGLIIVDCQYDFFPGGKLAVPDGEAIIPVINRWIDKATASGATIVTTRDWHPPEHCSFESQGGTWPEHCVQETHGAQLHDQINFPDDMILQSKGEKPSRDQYSGFDDTDLDRKLNDRGIERLWLTGLALDVCVQATAVDAAKRGFKVYVLLPGTRAVELNPGDARKAIDRIEKAGGQVIKNG